MNIIEHDSYEMWTPPLIPLTDVIRYLRLRGNRLWQSCVTRKRHWYSDFRRNQCRVFLIHFVFSLIMFILASEALISTYSKESILQEMPALIRSSNM